jgi:hypothetical protein
MYIATKHDMIKNEIAVLNLPELNKLTHLRKYAVFGHAYTNKINQLVLKGSIFLKRDVKFQFTLS